MFGTCSAFRWWPFAVLGSLDAQGCAEVSEAFGLVCLACFRFRGWFVSITEAWRWFVT